MTLARKSLAIFFCAFLPGLLLADMSSVQGWLDRMSQAGRSLNYEGTFVYQHHKKLETMRIVHKVDEFGERERLVSLEGAAREIIRNNKSVTCILPDDKAVMVDKSRPKKSFTSAFPGSFERLASYYHFSMEGNERVAGLDTRIVTIKPRDKFRYGYRLWLENETSLLLKSEKLDENAEPIERIVFTSISINKSIDDDDLRPRTSGREFTWYTEKDKDTLMQPKESPWKVDKLPVGFILKHYNTHDLPDSSELIRHIVFTDGLAWISVYIEPLRHGKEFLRGESHMGAVSAYGRVVGDYHVTVVGEVPSETTRMMGDSVRFTGAMASK